MIKKFVAMALAIALVSTSAIPVAEAGPRGRGYDNHGGDRDHGHHHQGRGHYKNGKWIALGILGAAAAAAVANSERGDCYNRRGRRYCD